jgi:hypothetical protein
MLRKSPDSGLRAIVVWEPVLWSDLTPPLTSVLAHVSDKRVAQFRDPGRLLSADLGRALRARPGEVHDDPDDDDIVWDCVAIYPPGTRWEEALPAPAYINCPVVQRVDNGNDLLKTGEPRRATRLFCRSLRFYPTDAWAFNNRGLAYLKMEKREKARRGPESARTDGAVEASPPRPD